MKKSCFIFLLIVLSSCSVRDKQLDVKNTTSCELDLVSTDTILIPTDFSPIYTVFKNQKIGEDYYHIGYNENREKLEFINLTTKEADQALTIDFSTIDRVGISEVNDFIVQDLSSIIVISEMAIYQINSAGKLIQKWLINRIDSPIKGIDFSQYTLSPNENCPAYFDKKRNLIYLRVRSLVYSQFDFDYFKIPIIGVVDLNTNEGKLLPVYYPEYMTKEKYGFAHRPRFTFNVNQLMVGFDNQSDCILYDLNEQTLNEIHIPTIGAPNKANTLKGPNDPIVMMEHSEVNSSFWINIYDFNNNQYFRPFFAPRGSTRTYGRGDLYLSIWSLDKKNIKETKIPSYFNPHRYFLNSDGIGFKNMKESTDDYLIINYLNDKCK
ncbi:MAG: hypothetical protein Sapg2KO_41800 [Saprospiraceae bacterium]